MQQLSEEWFAERNGKITGKLSGNIMPKRVKEEDMFKVEKQLEGFWKLVAGQLTTPHHVQNWNVWGTENEPEAIAV